MDSEIKSLSHLWLIFLIAVGLSTGILIAAGEKSISPKPATVADLSAARADSVAALSKNDDWKARVRTFNKNFLEPESSEWRSPPASQPVSAGIAESQQQTNGRLAALSVYGPSDALTADSVSLKFRSSNLQREVKLPTNAPTGPLQLDGSAVSFVLVRGFFSYAVTSAVNIPSNTLNFDQPIDLTFAVLPGRIQEVGPDHVHLQVKLAKLDSIPSTAEKHQAAGTTADISSSARDGKLNFDDLDLAHDQIITPAGRYTTLIIAGNGDLRRYVRCTRTDTNQQVGAYSDAFQLMTVAVNDWASVHVHLSVHNIGEELNYKIVSLSADDVTAKPLLLWFVTHELASGDADRILSLPEIDARFFWLKRALDVQFPDEEVRNIKDPDEKRFFDHLRSVHE